LEGDIEEVRFEVKQRMERKEEERKYRKKN
jgi:hypothetical protein